MYMLMCKTVIDHHVTTPVILFYAECYATANTTIAAVNEPLVIAYIKEVDQSCLSTKTGPVTYVVS